MCFSAPVSFAAAALLVPIGLRSLHLAWHSDRRLLGLAAFPLVFGIQQFIEGLLWLNLGGFHAQYTQAAALGFLFFVYVFWPIYVPLAARALEHRGTLRRILLLIAAFAGIMGGLLYLGLLAGTSELQVSVLQHSILYQHRPLFDLQWNDWVVRTGYALIVTLPLLASSLTGLRIFGALIALSLVLSALYFDHAFTSVWCFFAAILSMFILQLIQTHAGRVSGGLTLPNQPSQASPP